MKLVIMGAQGSGKGTQAEKLSGEYNIPHISTGDMFRYHEEHQTKLGEKVKGYTNSGLLVPDKIVIDIINDRLSNEDCREGFILDGFPRTIEQAKELGNVTNIDHVISIQMPDEVCVKRISGRFEHPRTKQKYNVHTSPKPDRTKFDTSGRVIHAYVGKTRLVRRKDDAPEEVRKRLQTYHEQTEPVIDFYENETATNVAVIDGYQSVETVFNDIVAALDK